ncbi:hypothetical protein HMPREF9997_02519 [Corynebacterium durum F0235]|uniref:Uncharacterized protein n=1 Tax=Corynebacterium durum F0235 TaxID=1035195 RepID=L1MAT1_9CORY|nr:hypothetical protein HMPREF9997_02519 [Corynebacterium durum F0235]
MQLETKYRDIADGNLSKFLTALPMTHMLETKYRDIADGNCESRNSLKSRSTVVGNQVPRYSGWKQLPLSTPIMLATGWKPSTAI